MGIFNILTIVLFFLLASTIFITSSQIIVVNVAEILNFSITNYSFLNQKNFFVYQVSLYNIGSKNFTAKLFLESECCKIFSENYKLNPAEEFSFSIYYLTFKNESINVSIIIENTSIPIKQYNISFFDNLEEINQSIFYIYENSKIKLIGNLDGYYFIILNQTTYQKRLKGNYNEIEINVTSENIKKVKIIFFNKEKYFTKHFELKNPNIFSKILFEVRKILTLIFSV